ncbi:hypothetical protein BT69DRAFT_1403456 [Atractiella rhizophila]|nr:hypothetical protein BT69DRAFT_1403456 [Atractiella rhizophila]
MHAGTDNSPLLFPFVNSDLVRENRIKPSIQQTSEFLDSLRHPLTSLGPEEGLGVHEPFLSPEVKASQQRTKEFDRLSNTYRRLLAALNESERNDFVVKLSAILCTRIERASRAIDHLDEAANDLATLPLTLRELGRQLHLGFDSMTSARFLHADFLPPYELPNFWEGEVAKHKLDRDSHPDPSKQKVRREPPLWACSESEGEQPVYLDVALHLVRHELAADLEDAGVPSSWAKRQAAREARIWTKVTIKSEMRRQKHPDAAFEPGSEEEGSETSM